MGNDIEIVVSGKNNAKDIFAQLNRSVSSSKRQATAAWKEFDVLALAAETAAHEIKNLQHQLDELSANNVKSITRAITELGTTAPAADVAAKSVDEIGDQARQSKREVDDLKDEIRGLKISKGLSGLKESFGNFSSGTKSVISGILSGISEGFSKAPGIAGKFFSATGPVGVVVASGITAAVGTALLTAVSGAGLSAAAGAGIALGITGAARDQRVVAAAGEIKQTLLTELSTIGTPFVKPIMDSLRTLGAGIGKLGLSEAFAPLANTIRPITAGLLSMAREAMPGIRQMVAAAVPFVRQLAADMPGLGRAVGDFAKNLAEAGPGAAKLFHSLLTGAEVAIRYFGTMVEWSGKFLDVLGTGLEKVGIFDFVNDKAAKFGEVSSGVATAVSTMISSTNIAAESAALLASELDAVKRAADDAWGAQMGLDEANLKLSDGLLSLTEAVRDNGLSLDEGTLKGNANREALLGLAKNAYDVYQAELAAGAGMSTASQHLYANLQALMDNAAKAGYNRDMVNQLLSAYIALAASPNINKTINIYYRKIGHEGEPVSGGYADIPTGRIGGMQRGGPVRAGQAYVVGETQAELFIPNQNGTIVPEVPRPGSPTPWGTPGYAQTAPTVNITVNALDSQGAAEAVMAAIHQWERRNGAGWRT